jgi:hypothetical protein
MLNIFFEDKDHVIFFLNGSYKAGIYRGGDKLADFILPTGLNFNNCQHFLVEQLGQQGLLVVKGGGNGPQPHFFIKKN